MNAQEFYDRLESAQAPPAFVRLRSSTVEEIHASTASVAWWPWLDDKNSPPPQS